MFYPCWYPVMYYGADYRNHYPLNCSKEEIVCDYFDIGEKAPDFTLEGIVNGQPARVSLSDYRGKWVVLFFYGSDFTFV